VPGRASNPTHWSRDGDAGVDPVRTGVVAGTVSVSNQGVSVGRRFAGAGVDVRVVEGLGGRRGAELLKTVLRTTTGEVRTNRAERH